MQGGALLKGGSSQKDSQKGFSFIDVLVGTALVLIVFLGIFGAYRLGVKVVGQSKNRISATAIANGQLEKIRNLSYASVGVEGGFPDGALPAATSTILNNVSYTIEHRVDFVVDTTDGAAPPDDDCPNDYKKAQVRVSWPEPFSGEVVLAVDVAAKNLADECQTGGGILSVTVFDAYGIPVPSPLIEVKDPDTDLTLKTATPDTGQHYFSLATSTYKVVVSKAGFSTERTYATDEVATPEKPHPIVLEGLFTQNSFSIDNVSSFSIDTLSPWGTDYFYDTFSDQSKISGLSDLVLADGQVRLATSSEGYLPSGYLISLGLSPGELLSWDEFSWSDSEPFTTDLKYQIYFASGTDWLLIPDEDLADNSVGFDISPVDLSGVSISPYSKLRMQANFSTLSTSSTPTLYDWQISWITSQAMPIAGVPFHLRGDNIIGTDGEEQPVYKYSATSTSDYAGHIDIANLEWDLYTFTVYPVVGLDLVDTDPTPQPIDLAPEGSVSVDLFLEAQNSLLVTVQNNETLEPVFGASVRLYNTGLSYDTTQNTDEQGQTYFIPLQNAVYDMDIDAAGYASASTTVSVFGDTTKAVRLEQIE